MKQTAANCIIHTKETTWIEGVWEQRPDENIKTYERKKQG
jgi:hypothetical protein